MREAVEVPPGRVFATWALLLATGAALAVALMGTPTGRQALVDERVRMVEAVGGRVDDARYARWQAAPPYWVYATSGGRVLLLPVITLAVAAALAAGPGRGRGFVRSLSVTVHASAVLVLQQAIALPLHLVRESLTSPFNIGALLPWFDEGTLPARVLGSVEVFGLWWVALLAFGCAALSGQPARRYLGPLAGVYAGVAVLVAGVVLALNGGS